MKTKSLILMMALMALPVMAVETSAPGQRIFASVNGLVCDFCAQAIKKTLLKEPGVTDVNVDLTAKSVVVGLQADATLIEKERLGKLLLDAGYDMTGYKVE